MLPAVALCLDILWIELSNSLIVELQPLLRRRLDEAEVVAVLSRADMHNDSLELVLELLAVFHLFLLLDSVVVDVELVGELPAGVDLLVLELVVVEADALQVHDEVVGQLAQQASLGDIAFFAAAVALVVRYRLPADELPEALVYVLEALDL